ncbi:MAG: hypothetical protein LBS07_03275 [Prevotellaceae bacterium]|jgi:hypothetical protein|nr:hypothetical protein [Prevotellaceae bacterium]
MKKEDANNPSSPGDYKLLTEADFNLKLKESTDCILVKVSYKGRKTRFFFEILKKYASGTEEIFRDADAITVLAGNFQSGEYRYMIYFT